MAVETLGVLGTRKSARNFRSGKENQERYVGPRPSRRAFDRGGSEVFITTTGIVKIHPRG